MYVFLWIVLITKSIKICALGYKMWKLSLPFVERDLLESFKLLADRRLHWGLTHVLMHIHAHPIWSHTYTSTELSLLEKAPGYKTVQIPKNANCMYWPATVA